MTRPFLLLFAGSIAFAYASTALANGRYPAAGQIVVDPNDQKHIDVRATYGLLTTVDRGASWYWTCESAVGYNGSEDPMFGVTSDGTTIAGTFANGLSISHDGCAWSFYPAPLAGRYVVDFALDAPGKTGVLMVSNSAGMGKFSTSIYETADSAVTWTQAGVDLPPEFLGLTLESAPSDANRVYVSGRTGTPGSIERSDDRGKTWTEYDVPDTADGVHLPYIAAVDPKDADVFYVRTASDPTDKSADQSGELLVTHDGGKSFSMVFKGQGQLLGFALAPDGSKLLFGGDMDGLYKADAKALVPAKLSSFVLRCLTWRTEGVYACADEFADKFTVGFSTDEGMTFTALMHLQALCGPRVCDPSTAVGQCDPGLWEATKATINSNGCEPDAGTSGATSGGATPAEKTGCSCSAGRSASAAWGALGALGLVCALAARRRRRVTGR